MKGHQVRLLLALAIAIAAVFAAAMVAPALGVHGTVLRYVYAAIVLVGGLALSRELGQALTGLLKPQLHRNSLVVGNAVSVCGSVLSAFAAATFAPISSTELFASAAFVGVVLGLALQPTLGSFFAGILILGSGAVRPGSQVRIVSWHIPFQWAFMPGYKYFSPDAIYAGYMGEVVHIGLFFTAIVTEEGQVMKVPNTILATDAAILEYTDRDFIFNVRYEFSVKFDPEDVLKRIGAAVDGYPVVSVRVNEQSDKQFYFVKIVLNAREKDHATLKSEILSKLVRIQRALEEENAK
jgi:small-conductance mechanosensitive channel